MESTRNSVEGMHLSGNACKRSRKRDYRHSSGSVPLTMNKHVSIELDRAFVSYLFTSLKLQSFNFLW